MRNSARLCSGPCGSRRRALRASLLALGLSLALLAAVAASAQAVLTTVVTTVGSVTAATPALPVPAPVAADAVLSRRLSGLAQNGVLVRYSVNEQVAGRLEVLLRASLAHRLGVSGPSAAGLPAGTPPQLVIAKALVVTTTGGRNGVRLFFSKRNAQRLSRQGKVSFRLRLILRNADSYTPTTTTVLSGFTLAR